MKYINDMSVKKLGVDKFYKKYIYMFFMHPDINIYSEPKSDMSVFNNGFDILDFVFIVKRILNLGKQQLQPEIQALMHFK